MHEFQYNNHLKAALILAAGSGSRMQSKLPKIMHNVCGLSIIQRIFKTLNFIDSKKIIVTLKHKSNLIKNHILSFNKKNRKVKFILQDNIPGTGRSVELVLNHILKKKKNFTHNDFILILCGDIPLLQQKNYYRNVKFSLQ